jgi:hypothetical protein
MSTETPKQFHIRLSEDEAVKVRRYAKATDLSVNGLFRLLVQKLGQPEKPNSPPKSTADITASSEELLAELDNLGHTISDVEGHLAKLVSRLTDVMRVPSFLEFRARQQVEGVDYGYDDKLANLVAQARAYYSLYRVWPDPTDSGRFGAFPFAVSDWPKDPTDNLKRR